MIISVRNPELAAALASRLPTNIPAESDVVVTDRVEVAAMASDPVAFIPSGLPAVLKALCDLDVAGILRAEEIGVGHLVSIASGSRVYSLFRPSDLGARELEWRIVALAANGVSPEEASELIGYSGRQIRRRLAELKEAAHLTHECRWTRLAPLFPKLSEL
ncbi:MAG: hypothetical protein KatS3mg011_0720 [Acidimicrobiia bacterium]|nr:MAG: hypothetical protein KatS3mg011_0720 [Acidimicrobiia bacterium]